MFNPILLPELRLMLAEGDDDGLKNFVVELHPASVAEFSEGLDVEDTWRVLVHAPLGLQAEIFSYYSDAKQDEMVHGSGRQRMSALLEEMAPDDRIDLLKRIDENVVEEILPLMAKAERQDIRTLLSYPDSSAGAVMTTEYASVPDDITAGEAISRLRLQAPDNEMIYYIYVLGRDRHLLGFVSLKTLILAKPNTLVADIMESDVVSVNVADDQEDVAKKLGRYDMLAIPVVDDNGRLVGIVTHDDVMDVMVEEATEDAHRMGGVAPIEGDYLETPFLSIWIKRSIWLSVLFVAGMFTFNALAHYHELLQEVVVLGLLVPLVIATGGNSGAQAATLITRAMSLGQITPTMWWKVLRHELLMGVALGITLGALGYLRALLIGDSILGSVSRWDLAQIVAFSAAGICLWGTIVGSMLPLIFSRFGVDPAFASGPFVATFVDVTGITIYFNIASWYLELAG